MKAGSLAIECSTVSHQHALDMARELRGRGLVYIDCPVTGLPQAAASGKLTLLVGADLPISIPQNLISRRSATWSDISALSAPAPSSS